jgi:zinc transport system substrate-binding protein
LKKLIMSILILCMAVFLISCNNDSKDTTVNNDKIQVSVTFNALAEFVSAVGKDKVEVSTIIPAGTEPHDFEPKVTDLAGINDAKVFIYHGLGMESWAEEAISAADNDDLIIVVASDGATPIKNTDEGAIDEHGEYDPHLWLSLKGAETEVQNIADGLSEADPDNKEYYTTNAKEYIEDLEDLYNEYNDKFSSLDNKNIVTGHAAFNYFCRDFNLTQNSVEDVYAEGEPSTKQLAELVDYCKENNVTTIFAEELASPAISQTLANEVGADIETIYTIEGPEDKLSYIERMQDNCEKIYKSLSTN